VAASHVRQSAQSGFGSGEQNALEKDLREQIQTKEREPVRFRCLAQRFAGHGRAKPEAKNSNLAL